MEEKLKSYTSRQQTHFGKEAGDVEIIRVQNGMINEISLFIFQLRVLESFDAGVIPESSLHDTLSCKLLSGMTEETPHDSEAIFKCPSFLLLGSFQRSILVLSSLDTLQ